VFELVYDRDFARTLRAIERKYHSLIRTTIEEQLPFEPGVRTRNRKPIDVPVMPDSRWELRYGPNNCCRVLYQVSEQTDEVYVLAIGVKERDRLMIGGEEIDP
jgi:mRNA-degrading endonuclease RelE of RelBE toxin-antitoxin system